MNVLSFGTVVGDGVTDDGPAIQAIIDAHPGRTIYFPTTPADPWAPGYMLTSYYCGNTLVVPDYGTGLCGDGGSTRMTWAPGVAGIRLAGGCNVIRDLTLTGSEGWYVSTGTWQCGVIPAGRGLGINDYRSTLAADHAAGSGTLSVISVGTLFGISFYPTPTSPFLVTVTRASDGAKATFIMTGFSGNTLTVVGTTAGTTDIALHAGDVITGTGGNNADGLQIPGGACLVSNLSIGYFGRDGVNMSQADLETAVANEDGYIEKLGVTNCGGSGVTVSGGDANCIHLDTPTLNNCQLWGIDFRPFLAGIVTSTQADNNGTDRTFSDNLALPAYVASLARAGNTVTLTWVEPYEHFDPVTGLMVSSLVVGQGVQVVKCPNASFVGRFRVLTVAGDHLSCTYHQLAPDGAITSGGTDIIGEFNVIAPDGVIASAVRAHNMVTLTFTVAYIGNGVPFRVGQGVTLADTPLSSATSFNGTFVVQWVSPDHKTVIYAQGGPDESISSGTFRAAVPTDTWAAAGAIGGAYHSPVGTAYCVWNQPYAEGGQRNRFATGNLILNPTWSDNPEYSDDWKEQPQVIRTAVRPTLNLPWSVLFPHDNSVTSTMRVGQTNTWPYSEDFENLSGQVLWEQIQAGENSVIGGTFGQPYWSFGYGSPFGPTDGTPCTLLRFTKAGTTSLNSRPGSSAQVNNEAGTGTGLVVGDGAGVKSTTIVGGSIAPAPLADAAAPNGSFYLSTDHLDGNGQPKLCRKDALGNVVVGF